MNFPRVRQSALFFLSVTMLLGVVTPVDGAFTWTGGGADDNWATSANWEPAGPPTVNSTATIPDGSSVLLAAPTAALAAFTLEAGALLTFEGWDSALTADEITIAGTITHAPNMTDEPDENGDWIPDHRVLIEGGNLTVAIGGKIDADETGYRGGAALEHGRGPGHGLHSSRGSGAGHGGLGGTSYVRGAYGGIPYGDPVSPWQPGSGGGGSSDQGGHGGGAIRINLTGALSVAGDITANGGAGSADASRGGGSGGSIWINCATFEGSGLIKANGGAGGGHGGLGSGGRIALIFDSAAQSALEATALRFELNYGGGGWHRPPALRDRALGSLYLNDAGPLGSNWSQWDGWLHLPTDTLEMAGDLTVGNCHAGLATITTLEIAGDLTIEDGGHLYLCADITEDIQEPGALLTVSGDFNIRSGGSFYPRAHPTHGAAVKIQVANLTIDSGGAINAEGRGFRGGSSLPTYDPDASLTGDGYGEGGGIAGGDSSGNSFYGGGGSYGGWGGDGYSSGIVRADGGDGISHGGGGGGGRIAFWISLPRNRAQTLARGKIEAIETRPQPSSFAGTTSVEGGFGNQGYADPGTVWWLIPQGTIISVQ